MPHEAWKTARRVLVAVGFAAAAGAVTLPMPAFAFEEASASAVNIDKNGLAICGYDPAAYFTLGQPTPGAARFTAAFECATYRFSTAANRGAFAKEPARYAPAFGGFCALGTSLEKKFDGDPNLWRIVGGKLYLNVAEAAVTRWQQDIPGNISKANQNWTKIKDKAPKQL